MRNPLPELCREGLHMIVLAVPPTSTDSSIFIRILSAKYRYTETTLYYTEEFRALQIRPSRAPVHPRPLGKKLLATSPAWYQCSSCSAYVSVSGDGMQESPK